MIAEILVALWTILALALCLGPVLWWLSRLEKMDRDWQLFRDQFVDTEPVLPPSRIWRWAIGLSIFILPAFIGGIMLEASEGLYKAIFRVFPY